MKNSSPRFVIALLALVIGGALEELAPPFAGVGFPVLLAAVPVFALRPPLAPAILFALAAGGMEDSLSGLPLLTSSSFFLIVGALVRWTRLPQLAAIFAYPVYQVWLSLWVTGLKGGVFPRILLSIPIGLFTFAAVAAVLVLVERKAGADEAG